MRGAGGGGRDGANRVELFHRGCELVLLMLLAFPVLTALAEVIEDVTLGRRAAESVAGGPVATDITSKHEINDDCQCDDSAYISHSSHSSHSSHRAVTEQSQAVKGSHRQSQSSHSTARHWSTRCCLVLALLGATGGRVCRFATCTAAGIASTATGPTTPPALT